MMLAVPHQFKRCQRAASGHDSAGLARGPQPRPQRLLLPDRARLLVCSDAWAIACSMALPKLPILVHTELIDLRIARAHSPLPTDITSGA